MTGIVTPTPIDALPPAPSPSDTAAEFNAKSFPFVAAEVLMVPQINTAAAQTNQNAVAANERAVAADASKSAAQAAAGTATAKAGESAASAAAAAGSEGAASASAANAADSAASAASYEGEAAGHAAAAADSASASGAAKTGAEAARDAAEDFRDQAEVFATKQLVASSTTSVTPGAGAKSFTIEASRSFVTGMYLVATSASDPNTRMSGYVQSYNGTTGALVIAVDAFAGASAKADWVIGVAARSADGSLVQHVITTNTTAVPGVLYVIAGATVTLTLPTAGLSNDSRIGIRLAAAVSGNQQIDFGSIPFRDQTPGLCYIDKPGFGLDLQFNTSTGRWI
jgi:hypothetical protein